MAEVICVGDLLIDFVPTVPAPVSPTRRLSSKGAGGAAANVAVGLARLGVSSAFMGRVGEDPFGHFLADTLADAGVDTGPLRVHRRRPAPPWPSSRCAADGEREFMFYRHPSADMLFTPEEVDFNAIAAAKAGAFRLDQPGQPEPRAATPVRGRSPPAAGQLVTFDVNLRLALWPEADTARAGDPRRAWPGRRSSSSATTSSSS